VTATLLEMEGVTRHFATPQGVVHAVDGVSLQVHRGETVGLVGESGSGKSTLGRVAVRLYNVTSGQLRFDGQEITRLRGRSLRRLRTRFQMVFQDPFSSLNPRMRVREIIAEPLLELLSLNRAERRQRVEEALDHVHLLPRTADRYPRELSGGQAQRVAIARALAVGPELVVADEPISSLDASVGAQIVNLLVELKQSVGVSFLFITHDLAVVRHICDRVAVMYLGRIVENAPTEQLFIDPQHPYTAALMSATPSAAGELGERRERIVLSGEIPDPTAVPTGCRFRTRCPIGPLVKEGRQICEEVDPPLIRSSSGGWTACHFPEDVAGIVRGKEVLEAELSEGLVRRESASTARSSSGTPVEWTTRARPDS
jgi:oligopeptide transport system ATP-binding protein